MKNFKNMVTPIAFVALVTSGMVPKSPQPGDVIAYVGSSMSASSAPAVTTTEVCPPVDYALINERLKAELPAVVQPIAAAEYAKLPAGPKGDAGPAGAVGPKGDTGPQGPQGPAGGGGNIVQGDLQISGKLCVGGDCLGNTLQQVQIFSAGNAEILQISNMNGLKHAGVWFVNADGSMGMTLNKYSNTISDPSKPVTAWYMDPEGRPSYAQWGNGTNGLMMQLRMDYANKVMGWYSAQGGWRNGLGSSSFTNAFDRLWLFPGQ